MTLNPFTHENPVRGNAVDTVGFDTLAFRTAAFDFPQTDGDFYFGTELSHRTVDRNTDHDRSERQLLVPFKEEQNLERTAHNSVFLKIAKINSTE